MAVKEKKKIKKTIRDKKIKKTKQKGGLEQDIPAVLQEYFTFFLNLLNIYNEAYNTQQITAIFKKSIVFSNKNIGFLYFYINYFIL